MRVVVHESEWVPFEQGGDGCNGSSVVEGERKGCHDGGIQRKN